MNYAECLEMVAAFRTRALPLWVAYYRRALPRFLKVRELLRGGAIGRLTAVHVHITDRLATGSDVLAWRFNPAIAGAGLFLDLASHCVDLVDFLAGPVSAVSGFAVNSGGAYAAEDVTAAAFQIGTDIAGTGVWNFNAAEKDDRLVFTGSVGTVTTPIFTDGDVLVARAGGTDVLPIRNPPHVHQPLIQSIVDELGGRGRCDSTGESGARASWVMDQCVAGYYAGKKGLGTRD
jgi:predicted dehydrogenase